MPIHTLVPNISLIEAFASASRNAGTADQTGIDLTLYEGELDALISCGSVGASGTLDAKWQESDDNSTFTDCTGADTNGNAVSITQITAAGTARIKRTDPGDPAKCPVWQLHCVYSDEKKREWVQQGCRSAAIGCIECKQPVIDAVIAEQTPMRERAQKYIDDPTLVRNIVADGCEKARKMAQETLRDVREVMGLGYG